MGIFGNADRSIPPATVDAFEKGLQSADVGHVIHRYDANHAFANPSSRRYDTKAAADAWRKAAAFLAKHLRQS
ncbi:MAG: dienelactone hydrolase family protein [Pirellulales bacterium]|nr:dienelactone hydrolase family protein [Pirellulales bacterium]